MNNQQEEPKVDFQVFSPAVVVVLLVTLPLMIFPQPAAQIILSARAFIMDHFMWLYLIAGLSALAFCIWLAFG